MQEFITQEWVRSLTFFYMLGFVYYHVLVGILWYFKKRACLTLYPEWMILFSVVQGVGVLFGAITHWVYVADPRLIYIAPYFVFGFGIIFLCMSAIYGLVVYRRKIVGDL